MCVCVCVCVCVSVCVTTAPSADLVSISYTKCVVSPECGWASTCEFTYSYYLSLESLLHY